MSLGLQRLAVDQGNLASGDPDQASSHEVPHGAGDRFTAGADHLTDEVMGEPPGDDIASLIVCRLQQLIGHPAADIQQHQAADAVVGAAQSTGQFAEQGDGQIGRGSQATAEVLSPEQQQPVTGAISWESLPTKT